MLTLDDNHKYAFSGVPVPGFTEIIGDLGITEPSRFYTEAGREEGTMLHEWLFFLASGGVPAEEPDERIAGRVEGIRKFLRESAFVFEGGEKILYHPGLVFACKPDLWGMIGGVRVVLDAKRGARQGFHSLQTAAQKMALSANGIHCRDRYGLYLKDGDYRLEAHADKADEDRWRAIVTAYHAKRWYTKGGT